ncbi:hypothetical protein LCGC14_0940340 [marine sediment metagenome]|uniref:Uncharacterized protein n=1 Tax=marine sediment metagenome TaxID=412755 RepID=A0A0F9R3X9_9ZZZZ
MYKTMSVWIEGERNGEKLMLQSSFIKDDPWLRIEGHSSGDVSFHFDADGLRQFVEALEGLEKDILKAKKEEVKVKDG